MLGLGKDDSFKKINPKKWKIQHTKDWLKEFKNQFENDTQFDFNPLLICNGELLITFSIEVFKEISPLFGRLLYESLHLLINSHIENDIKNNTDNNKLFNDKILNNSFNNYKKYKRERSTSWYPKDPLFMRTSQSRLQFTSNNDLIYIQNREITMIFKEFLINEFNKKGNRNIYLQGINGIGKSHTMYQIVCELREDSIEEYNNDIVTIETQQVEHEHSLSISTTTIITNKNRVAYIPDYGCWFGFGIEETIHLFIYSLLIAYELNDDKFISEWWSFIKKSTYCQTTKEYTQNNVIKFLKELEQYNIENQLKLYIFIDQHLPINQQPQILSKFPWNLPITLSTILSTTSLIIFTTSDNNNEHFQNYLKKNINSNWTLFTINSGFTFNEFKLWKDVMKCKALESNEINLKLSYITSNIPLELSLFLSNDNNKFKSPKEAFSNYYSFRIHQISLDISKFRSKLTTQDEKNLFEKSLALMELRLPIGSEEILIFPQYMITEYIPIIDNKSSTSTTTTTTTKNSLNKLLTGGYYIIKSFNPMIQNVLIKSTPSYQILKEYLDKFTIQIFSNGFHLNYNKDLCCFAAEMYLLRKIINDKRIKFKTHFTKGSKAMFYPTGGEIIKINNLYHYEIYEQTSLDEINPPWLTNSLIIVPKSTSFKDVEFYLWDSIHSKLFICQLTIKDPDQHRNSSWQQLIHHNIWKEKLKKSGIIDPKVYSLFFGPHFDNSGEYVSSFDDLSDTFPLFKFYNSTEWLKIKR